MNLQPGVVVGENYRLESLLGQGGMGVVWKATDLKLGRTVAIKILHTDLRGDPQLGARFEREARLLASIDHPAIVGIYTWLTIQDAGGETYPCIVMPFVNGQPLADVVRAHGALRIDLAVSILASMLDALTIAHQAGIIHRDLKPHNVILEQRPGRTQVRLLDFGIAKSLHEASSATKATQAGTLLGTPGYMSPEQIQNPGGVDARADLWAAAVCFYEMITGRVPYDGSTPIETLSKVLTSQVIPATQINPNLPPTINGFFQRALARDIAQRPASAADMMKLLDGISIGRDKTAPFDLGSLPGQGGAPPGPASQPGHGAPMGMTPPPVAPPMPMMNAPMQSAPGTAPVALSAPGNAQQSIGAHNFQPTVGLPQVAPASVPGAMSAPVPSIAGAPYGPGVTPGSPVSGLSATAPVSSHGPQAVPQAPQAFGAQPAAPSTGFGAQPSAPSAAPSSGFGAQPSAPSSAPSPGFGAIVPASQGSSGFGAMQPYASNQAMQPAQSPASLAKPKNVIYAALGLVGTMALGGVCMLGIFVAVIWKIFF